MIHIIPSLASANQLDLKTAIDKLKGIDRIHIDIEDGNFIPNITFGLKTVRNIAEYTNRNLDVHLMVTDPSLYLDDLLDLKVTNIAVHAEVSQYLALYLNKIRGRGGRAGVAMNLQTPVEIVNIYEDLVDYVLIMTSEPDMRHQEFRTWSLQKIAHARSILSPRISIVVDGGITGKLLPQVVEAGADTIIMGREIWTHENVPERFSYLVRLANEAADKNSM